MADIELRGIEDAADEAVEQAEQADDSLENEVSVEIADSQEAPEGEEGTEDQAEHKPAPGWVREVRNESRQVRKENRQLRQELAMVKAQINGKGAEIKPLGPKPTLAQHDYDETKFAAALEDWHAQKAAADAEAAKAEAAAKAETEAWQGRLAEYAKRKVALGAKDFDDAEAVVLDLLDTTQQGIIVHGSADPALVVYALGTNEDKARELAKIKDPVQFAFAVARLEGQMKVSKNRPTTSPEGRVVGERRPAGGDAALERLRAEADKTGDYSKVNAYKRKMAGR